MGQIILGESMSQYTLKILQDLVDELNATNSSNEKKEILKKHTECQSILCYVYDPFMKYNVTSKNCKKRSDLVAPTAEEDIFSLLDKLCTRMYTGHDAISAVNAFVNANKEYEELIWLIIDKNLKTRTDDKLINKVWPNMIPSFDVALANKYDDKTAKKVSFDGKWFCSRKLDGLRCITIIDAAGNIKFYSRAGNEFTTLDNVRKAIEPLKIYNTVLDGEICIVDENGNEDFTAAVSQVKRKDFTIENPSYKIFDAIPLADFKAKKGKAKLSDRLFDLSQMIPKGNPVLEVLKQVKLTEENFLKMQEDVKELGWEGLILRKDVPYEGKRSHDMLKVKKFHDAEYVVKDVEMGLKPMLNSEGLMEEVDVLAAVKIEHKGAVVSVGSGFSDADRLYYHKNPKEIIGSTICVQYFEESQDSNGKPSLRFPTIKFIYGKNGRDV